MPVEPGAVALPYKGLARAHDFRASVVALAAPVTSLVTRSRDRLLDAIKDISERVTRVETRIDRPDMRVEGSGAYLRGGQAS